jgi:hypothetical protein
MDPLAPGSVNLASAVQALLVRQGTTLEASTLLALLGQDLEVLFQALTPEGAKLRLPSGQTLTAQGELPYPEGTQFRVRVLPAAPGETSLRLQLQEARPPSPPALLAPLFQSEAQTLTARLSQEPPVPELAPLLRLLAILSDPPRDSMRLPAQESILTALKELPETLRTSLGRLLGTGGMASSQELAATLVTRLEDLQHALATGTMPLPFQTASVPFQAAPEEAGAGAALARLIQQVVLRFQSVAVPEEHRETLTTWLRNLLQKSVDPPPPAKGAPPSLRAIPQAHQAPVPPKLLAALGPAPGPKADLPESWEAWIRGTVQTLADPIASPREAAFHALQAKEGTAFFELPLPWAQASPLQLWVEGDAPEERKSGGEPTRRVLLGLTFSSLGETRLGLAQGSFGLQVRVWTEQPEALEPERLKQELEELGKPVDLKIYALTYGPDGTIPSLRSLVTGPSLRALG